VLDGRNLVQADQRVRLAPQVFGLDWIGLDELWLRKLGDRKQRAD